MTDEELQELAARVANFIPRVAKDLDERAIEPSAPAFPALQTYRRALTTLQQVRDEAQAEERERIAELVEGAANDIKASKLAELQGLLAAIREQGKG